MCNSDFTKRVKLRQFNLVYGQAVQHKFVGVRN